MQSDLRKWMRLVEATGDMPTQTFDVVYHVGTMNIAHKGSDSWEGAGLSVTTHPEKWMQIIPHITDHPETAVWRGVRPGNRFLDLTKLRTLDKRRIIAWGVEQGYLAAPDNLRQVSKAFMRRVRWAHGTGSRTLDLLGTVYAEDVMQIDGVWWAEFTSAHMAPRGVINPTALPHWQFTRDPTKDADPHKQHAR